MGAHLFILNKLLLIQEKYPEYFEKNNIDILSCVYINHEPPVSINKIHEDIPFEIRDEIESIFWID